MIKQTLSVMGILGISAGAMAANTVALQSNTDIAVPIPTVTPTIVMTIQPPPTAEMPPPEPIIVYEETVVAPVVDGVTGGSGYQEDQEENEQEHEVGEDDD